jgi:hypothetical protein
LRGAKNAPPSFITDNGTVREARFIYLNARNPNGGLDGGVHDPYTIAGRSDALGCTLPQTNFARQISGNNVILRIPTPLFASGWWRTPPMRRCRQTRPALRRRGPRLRSGHLQHQGQRWHDYAVWLESAEQIAVDVRRRSL